MSVVGGASERGDIDDLESELFMTPMSVARGPGWDSGMHYTAPSVAGTTAVSAATTDRGPRVETRLFADVVEGNEDAKNSDYGIRNNSNDKNIDHTRGSASRTVIDGSSVAGLLAGALNASSTSAIGGGGGGGGLGSPIKGSPPPSAAAIAAGAPGLLVTVHDPVPPSSNNIITNNGNSNNSNKNHTSVGMGSNTHGIAKSPSSSSAHAGQKSEPKVPSRILRPTVASEAKRGRSAQGRRRRSNRKSRPESRESRGGEDAVPSSSQPPAPQRLA